MAKPIEPLISRERDLLSLKNQTLKRVEKLGFEEPDKPENRADLPTNVTSLPSKALGTLFNKMLAWESYAGWQLAIANLELELADYAVTLAILREQRKLDGGIQARKAEAMATKRVREAQYQLKKATAIQILLQATYDRTVRNSQYVSREITRRQNEARE
jgi:hypothetical protein